MKRKKLIKLIHSRTEGGLSDLVNGDLFEVFIEYLSIICKPITIHLRCNLGSTAIILLFSYDDLGINFTKLYTEDFVVKYLNNVLNGGDN